MKHNFLENKNSNIFLTGFMGCGKTSVGKVLSKKLEKKFFDLDDIVEEYMGKSAFEVIEQFGLDYFRKIETQKLSVVCTETNAVISLGGGTLMLPNNQELVKKSGFLIHLMASEDTLVERLEKSHKRPLLKKLEIKVLRNLLIERENGYSQADFYLKTDGFSPDEVCHMILEVINK